MRGGVCDRDTGYAERAPRLPYRMRAIVHSDSEQVATETLDLSRSGVALAYSGRLRIGARLAVTFAEAPQVSFQAQVVRRWRKSNRACAALAFTRMPREAADWLSDRLRRLQSPAATSSTRAGTLEPFLREIPSNAAQALAEIEQALSTPPVPPHRLVDGRSHLLQIVEVACRSSERPMDEATEIDARLREITPYASEEALAEIGAIRRYLRQIQPHLMKRDSAQ